ncbi:MAG: hypothetical protein KGJ93_04265 [Patescibacteria group bacterium]|nr:hypothetical protein [Patescibacteria group bacterium]
MTKALFKFFTVLLAAQMLLAAVVFLTAQSQITKATLGMGLGLVLIWVGLGGWLSYKFKNSVKRLFSTLPGSPAWKFFLFSLTLAMLEEAIAVLMTNTAPLYGLGLGQAYITASTNYWDTIFGHSVILFLPQFAVWALILKRYNFKPLQVMLLFGLTGTLMEASLSGGSGLLEAGMWVFVYGLMMYLPAYCLPKNPLAKPLRWYHFPLAVILPLLSIPLAAPLLILLRAVRPSINHSLLRPAALDTFYLLLYNTGKLTPRLSPG